VEESFLAVFELNGISDERQTEIQAAELLVPDWSAFRG
jgi:hypothetical protein